MSIIAEEIGSLGALLVLGMLFYLMFLIMEKGVRAESQYTSLICFGVTAIIFFQTLFNVGAVLGLLPITGVTLPFISYGGSSLWVLSAAIGLILNVDREEKEHKEYLRMQKKWRPQVTINQELADLDLPKRTSLIVYLRNANSDQFKLRRLGDIVYFSKKMHYLIMYVDQEKVEETLQQLEKLTLSKRLRSLKPTKSIWTTSKLKTRSRIWLKKQKKS